MDSSLPVEAPADKQPRDLELLKKRSKRARYRRWAFGYTFAFPFFLLFAIFIVFPVIYGLILSLTNYNIMQPPTWAGFENYRDLFTNDSLFLKAVSNTFSFMIILGPTGFAISFLFAWAISQLKLRNVFALMFYIPSVLGTNIVTLMISLLFASDSYGFINAMMMQWGIVQEPIIWNTIPRFIWPIVIVMALWSSLNSGFLVNLAGLSGINESLYEAAAIDGVRTRVQELIYITLPAMKPQLLYNAIMTTVGVVNFNDIAASFAGFPSPEYCVHTMVGHMGDHGFTRYELGYASAISFMLFLISFILGRVFMKVLSSEGE